jgi:hypothetical protein
LRINKISVLSSLITDLISFPICIFNNKNLYIKPKHDFHFHQKSENPALFRRSENQIRF